MTEEINGHKKTCRISFEDKTGIIFPEIGLFRAVCVN
jgi:hypothetical protein